MAIGVIYRQVHEEGRKGAVQWTWSLLCLGGRGGGAAPPNDANAV